MDSTAAASLAAISPASRRIDAGVAPANSNDGGRGLLVERDAREADIVLGGGLDLGNIDWASCLM